MTTTETFQKRQYKPRKITLWLSSMGLQKNSPRTSGVNQFHKLNTNFCYYDNKTWTLEFPPTPMSTVPTTMIPNHSSQLARSLLSTTILANVNSLQNIARRDISWEHLLNNIVLGTYGRKHYAQPEFWLLFFTSTSIFPIQSSHQRMQSSRPQKTWPPHSKKKRPRTYSCTPSVK